LNVIRKNNNYAAGTLQFECYEILVDWPKKRIGYLQRGLYRIFKSLDIFTKSYL